jgi:phenylpropionate dioxygenase-like ring-hydroxylating dioxygenase large terminal subunit
MLDARMNERLVRVGRGTPMGEVFRRFWLPVCQLKDLHPGGAPVEVRLLGEDLLAFRGPDGNAGVVDRFCAHRGADLRYARNEAGGLRCIFHGWKYGGDGQCVEIPNVPEGNRICPRVKIKSYPVQANGGLLWCYMGPAEQKPPAPVLPWMGKGEAHWSGTFVQVESEGNYLQHVEGLCDGSHVGFLHSNLQGGGGGSRFVQSAAFSDRTPRWAHLEDTPYGAALAMERDAGRGKRNLRLNQFLLPFSVEVPTPPPYAVSSWQTNVPMDDEHTMFLYTSWYDPTPIAELRKRVGDRSYEVPALRPGGYKPEADRAAAYGQDRGEYMQQHSFSGMRNLRLEDMAVAEFVRGGHVADRSAETLVSSDRAIVKVRARLLALADKLEQQGHLHEETQAVATHRVVPAEMEIGAGDDVAARCRSAGVSAVAPTSEFRLV